MDLSRLLAPTPATYRTPREFHFSSFDTSFLQSTPLRVAQPSTPLPVAQLSTPLLVVQPSPSCTTPPNFASLPLPVAQFSSPPCATPPNASLLPSPQDPPPRNPVSTEPTASVPPHDCSPLSSEQSLLRSTTAAEDPESSSASSAHTLLPDGFIDTGGASSWASRNPLKEVQAPRYRPSRSKADAVKKGLSHRAIERDLKADLLKNGVAAIIRECNQGIEVLAKELDISVKTIREKVTFQTSYIKHRQANAFNALVHQKGLEMNEDRDYGNRHKLKDIQARVRQDLDDDKVTESDTEAALKALEETRALKSTGSRSSNRAADVDARMTVNTLTDEVVYLGERTRTTGLALFAKGHIHDDFANSVVEYNGSSAFFLEVLNIAPLDVLTKFEQWVCAKDKAASRPDNLTNMSSECSTIIKEGLRKITNIPNISMNYANYAVAIVQKYHVQLVGWPQDIPFASPSNVTTVATMRKLRQVLGIGTCAWMAMSKRQQKEHDNTLAKDTEGGEVSGKKRKERSNKGKKRKRAGAEEVSKENDGLTDQDDDENEIDEDDENNPPPAKKKKQQPAIARKTKKSASTHSGAIIGSSSGKSGSNGKGSMRKTKSVASKLPPVPKSRPVISDSEDEDEDDSS